MRFKKFGKALLMGVLSAGIIFGVTSCVESYTVGFLYVTGTVTASSGSSGIISGYKIDHNTGKLNTIDGLPVSSGGANPVRAVLTLGSRFLYVLNRGVNNAGNGNCYGVGAAECQNANITQYAVGGNGILTPQETFYTQGLNPFRLIVDSTGNYLMVLDHDAPDNASPSTSDNCARALGNLGTANLVTTCGDITVFQINQTTGRLSLVVNAQVTAANGSPLTYFPVPANPVDFVLSGGFLLTLTGTNTPTSYPYTGGTSVWPYTYASSSGQLTLSQNSAQALNIKRDDHIQRNLHHFAKPDSPLYHRHWRRIAVGAKRCDPRRSHARQSHLCAGRVQGQVRLCRQPGQQHHRSESGKRPRRILPHHCALLSAQLHRRRAFRLRFGSAVHRRRSLESVHLRSQRI
jgi:hypothetical protein